MQEFYHEFFLKLHNGRISLARLDKLVDKLWVLVKVDQSKYGNLEITINMIKKSAAATNNNKQNKRTTRNTLDIFQNQFCINEALSKLENNLLITPL